MNSKFFQDCEVIAGFGGLDRQIHAVGLFDAPDGYKWFKGKEFVLTSGYLFKENTRLFRDVILHLHEHNSAAMGIKVQRFLGFVPDEIIDLCNRLDFPLISLPYHPAWIDVINAVNAVALNSYIMRLHERKNQSKLTSLYPADKVGEAVETLSEELQKPVAVIDLLEQKTYSCPASNWDLPFSPSDLWEPSFDYQKERICEKLNICRVRNLTDPEHASWVIVPVTVKGTTAAYLVILEPSDLVDHYDLLGIRLTLTILDYIYEQVYYMSSKEALFQDELIREITEGSGGNDEVILRKAKNLQWDIRDKYVCLTVRDTGDNQKLHEYRDSIASVVNNFFSRTGTPLGIVNGGLVILHSVKDVTSSEREELRRRLKGLIDELEKAIPGGHLYGGIGQTATPFPSVRSSYVESLKAVEIGQYIYPQRKVISYADLGPFKLLRLESLWERDPASFADQLAPILEQADAEELLATLRAYLDSESSYNLASRKLFVHSNTVRYRLAKIQQLCSVDLGDPVERLKLELSLRFLKR